MVSIQAGNPITGDAVVKSILAVLDPSPRYFWAILPMKGNNFEGIHSFIFPWYTSMSQYQYEYQGFSFRSVFKS